MRYLVVLFLLVSAMATSQAQVKARFGLRAGLATSDVTTEELNFQSGSQEFGIAVQDVKFAMHGGLFLQITAGKFIFQPEVLFRSSRTDYLLREFTSAEIISSVREEKYQYLDVPLMFGVKWGPLRLQAGPVGSYFINSNSEFTGVAQYEPNFEAVSLGYQAGIGLDLWNVLLDFKYQGAFNGVGSHLNFGGQQIDFATNPSQLVITAGFSFN